jgi:hypothetical protein
MRIFVVQKNKLFTVGLFISPPTSKRFFFPNRNNCFELSTTGNFTHFEQRIACRVYLCEIAHLYYQMMLFLLQSPLTLQRFTWATHSAIQIEHHLTTAHRAIIFKLLLNVWIEVRLSQYYQTSSNPNPNPVSDNWIMLFKPVGYNAFHFLQQIISHIKMHEQNQNQNHNHNHNHLQIEFQLLMKKHTIAATTTTITITIITTTTITPII